MNDVKKILEGVLGHCIDNGTDELYFICPFCVGEHTGGKRFVFGFNTRKNAFGCNRCHEAGGLRELAKRLHFDVGREIESRVKQTVGMHRTVKIRLPWIELNDDWSDEERIPGIEAAAEYANRRGFLRNHVSVGYSKRHLYYVILPILDSIGSMIYYQGRRIFDDSNLPKTVNPKIPKPPVLYAPFGFGKQLILVEGLADAIAVKGQAMLGKTLTRDQKRMIERLVRLGGIEEIIVWLDSDAQGDAIMLADNLQMAFGRDMVNCVYWKDIEGDPDNVTDKQRKILLKDRVGDL